jgi:hypothetical protein
LHCFAAKIFHHSRSLTVRIERRSILTSASSDRRASEKRKKKKVSDFPKLRIKMVRVRSTAKVVREGDEAEGSDTVPISEAMRRSGLVTTEETPAAEAKPTAAEGEGVIEETDSEDDYHIAMPSKPSHLDFGKSTVSKADLSKMIKAGYFNEDQKKLLRFGGEETIPKPGEDEIVIFKSFLKAGLRFPLHNIIAEILKKFGIYFHQLTPNAIVRLNVYIWALRSQAVEPFADSFCRVHELHYQTKARKDGLHDNFGCYNFAYRKTTKCPVISYRSKWPAGWKSEWFYVKVDEDKEKLVQSPLDLIFGETRPRCRIGDLEGPTWAALSEFEIISKHIGTRDLVQEFLAFRVFPTLKEWEMPKLKGEKKKGELVRLPYHFKFKKYFKKPCKEWLDTVEVMCNEILGNYSKKEDQLMTAAFGARPKRRLNRVFDALGFEYPDYERLNKGAEGHKRKRVAETLTKDEEQLAAEKKIPKKRKISTPKRKISEEEGTPTPPSTSDVEEILKVMTEPMPTKLSPLGLQLTKLFQKVDEPDQTKISKPKRQRIIAVTEVIDKTPPRASVQKTAAAESTINVEVAPSEVAATEAATAEDVNLETTIEDINKILEDMAAEEAGVATEKSMAAVPEKGKEIAEDTSDDEAYSFQNLVGQKLTKDEIEELKDYAKSCGYKSGALLFGGVDDEKLGCIRDQTGAKVIGTLSKSIGFPKLETDISRYRRQHIVGSLFYSNFKVNNLFSGFYCR